MPELPEVETTRLGILPYVEGKQVKTVVIRQSSLRWPIPVELPEHLHAMRIQSLRRRGKYLLMQCATGTVLLHLGMSGSLRVLPHDAPIKKHDHVDFVFADHLLRFHDPRRFGAILWTPMDPAEHKLIKHLGVEPLTRDFTGRGLWQLAQKRSVAVKKFIMNGQVVVGVGNIYATEALFLAGIHPAAAAKSVSLERYQYLVKMIKKVLRRSIKQGGTTLRDFVGSDGQPGYFAQTLKVYGRAGEPCVVCGESLLLIKQDQRSTVYCPECQS